MTSHSVWPMRSAIMRNCVKFGIMGQGFEKIRRHDDSIHIHCFFHGRIHLSNLVFVSIFVKRIIKIGVLEWEIINDFMFLMYLKNNQNVCHFSLLDYTM